MTKAQRLLALEAALLVAAPVAEGKVAEAIKLLQEAMEPYLEEANNGEFGGFMNTQQEACLELACSKEVFFIWA